MKLSSLPQRSAAERSARFATPLALAAALGLWTTASGCDDASATPQSTVAATTKGVPADPLEAKIELGRKLFFDGKISRPQGVSCGMCHNPKLGWGDARPQGKGVQDHTLAGDVDGDGNIDHETTQAIAGNRFKTILTPRNTPTIYNSNLFANLFWDGRAGDLIHQSTFPVEAAFEMNTRWDDLVLPYLNADAEYNALFTAAFGDANATRERAGDAMGSYEATITANDSPYDDFLAGSTGALTGAAKRGHDLFFGAAGCGQCHPGPSLTDFQFHNTGVPTAGTFVLTGELDFGFGKRTDLTQDPAVEIDEPQDYMKFKTPQLRMVGVTGPYMHNGAFETLEEVIEFYDQGGGPDLSPSGTKSSLLQPLNLTDNEKADLLEFLESGLLGTEIR